MGWRQSDGIGTQPLHAASSQWHPAGHRPHPHSSGALRCALKLPLEGPGVGVRVHDEGYAGVQVHRGLMMGDTQGYRYIATSGNMGGTGYI